MFISMQVVGEQMEWNLAKCNNNQTKENQMHKYVEQYMSSVNRQEGLQLISQPQIHPIVENNICQLEPRLYPSILQNKTKITPSYVPETN